MRKLTLTCLIATAIAGSPVFAVAAQPVQPASVQPEQNQLAKYVYDDGEEEDDYVYDDGEEEEEEANIAADQGQPPEELAPAAESSEPLATENDRIDTSSSSFFDSCSGNSCDSYSSGRSGWRDSIENFTLDGALGWECCSYNVGGWTEMGYTTNNVPLSQSYNDLLSFSDVPDNVNLYQQWLYVEKTVDGTSGWDLGGRIDAIYGTDAQKTQSFGNPNGGVRGFGFFDASWDHNQYGFAMPQLYGEVAYHDLAVKVGHFFTPMGYEVIPAVGNFFFTHSYTFFNSEPFTHTGALASYTGYEGFTLYGGWTLGWDTGFDQLNSGSNFLGGFSSEIDDAVTFTYICTAGNFGWRDGGSSDSYNHSIVLLADVSDDLQYVFQSDNLRTDNPGVSAFDTIGAVNYLFYSVTDSSKLGGRIEWWKADGVSFNEFTIGWNYNALKSFVIRPEWRQDWAPGIGLDEDTFAIDAIWSY